jgi:hypothetical protein
MEDAVTVHTCSTREFSAKACYYFRLAEQGDIVRVMNSRRANVRAWIIPGEHPPAALDGVPDDVALIKAGTRRKHRQEQLRARAARQQAAS